MLDTRTDNVLADWRAEYAELFSRHTLCLKHKLHLSPLFSDESLARLIETADRNDYHVNFMDNGVRREGEFGSLSGAEVLEAVKRGKIWINLRAPGKGDAGFNPMLDDIFAEFEGKVPGFESFRHNMTILISSPGMRVKYHADVPGQSLWQIRGKKKVYLWPAAEPFLTQNALEKLIIGEVHETDMAYQPWFDDYATIKDLEPGEMLHWPLNGPHKVENYDMMNVSLTTEHWTKPLRNIYGVNYANAMLRKMGFSSLSQPKSGPSMWAKLAIAGAVKFSGLRKKTAKPYRIDFAVDPNGENGVRDITPYDLRK